MTVWAETELLTESQWELYCVLLGTVLAGQELKLTKALHKHFQPRLQTTCAQTDKGIT